MIKKTMKQKVLEFIKDAGKKGRKFGEIQRYIVEVLHDYDYDEMVKVQDKGSYQCFIEDGKKIWKYIGTYKNVRRHRGYWCTNLLGGMYYPMGILPKYCTKINGRWIYND